MDRESGAAKVQSCSGRRRRVNQQTDVLPEYQVDGRLRSVSDRLTPCCSVLVFFFCGPVACRKGGELFLTGDSIGEELPPPPLPCWPTSPFDEFYAAVETSRFLDLCQKWLRLCREVFLCLIFFNVFYTMYLIVTYQTCEWLSLLC